MSSKPPSSSSLSLPSSLSTALTTSDAFLTRLTLLLSTPRTADILLMTLTYTLRLLSSLTTALTTPARLSLLPIALLKPLSHILSPTSPLLRFQSSSTTLAKLIDDARTFTRLWGLLSIYAGAKRTLSSPPSSPLLLTIRCIQILFGGVFQGCENVGYLASRGVIRLKGGDKAVKGLYLWSARAWMGSVGLEMVRLGVEGLEVRRRKIEERGVEEMGGKEEGEGEKEVLSEVEAEVEAEAEAQRKKVEAKWWRDMRVNAAWMPVTVHYSLEEGFLGQGAVAVLGLVPALTALREVWGAST